MFEWIKRMGLALFAGVIFLGCSSGSSSRENSPTPKPAALSITTQPASQVVNAGTTVTFSVSVSGGVAPYHYQWKQHETPVGTDSASLSLSNVQASQSGNYTVTVTDAATPAAQLTSAVATLTVKVPPPSGGTLTVYSEKGGVPQRPVWLAFQAAPEAPWQDVTLSGTPDSGKGGHRYALSVTDAKGRYGLAWASPYQSGGQAQTTVCIRHATLLEGAESWIHLLVESPAEPTQVTLSGRVVGLSNAEAASVNGALVLPATGATYTQQVPKGIHDLVATKFFLSSQGMERPHAFALQRNLSVNANTVADVDFNTTGFSPVVRHLQAQGSTASEKVLPMSMLVTSNGGTASLSAIGATSSLTTLDWSALPAERLQAGDHYLHAVHATEEATNSRRSRSRIATSAQDMALALPPSMAAATISSPGSTPYRLLRAQWPALSMPTDAVIWNLGAHYVCENLDWDLQVSKGWLGQTEPFEYALSPDFVGHPNWNAAWGLPGTADVAVELSYLGTSASPGQSLEDGFSTVRASRTLAFKP